MLVDELGTKPRTKDQGGHRDFHYNLNLKYNINPVSFPLERD